jgi:hypothetical protein
MSFAEKLAMLTDGLNKSNVSRKAGLKATAICGYISQPPPGRNTAAVQRL